MNGWMLSLGYVGGLAASSLWAREWARRKGLNTRFWGMTGALTGPVGLAGLFLARPKAIPCPHCGTPLDLSARYCPVCRAREAAAREIAAIVPAVCDSELEPGFLSLPADEPLAVS